MGYKLNNRARNVDDELKIFENFKLKILEKPQYDKKELLQKLYWYFHPRFSFFKTLPYNTKLLDIGAGSGGLVIWKNWIEPFREDMQLYAIDKTKGEFFDKFVDVQTMDLDKDTIKFEDDFFDGVFLSHVIEHVKYPRKLLKDRYFLCRLLDSEL